MGTHALIAPALPAVVEDLIGAIFLRRIAPAHPVAIDEDYARQDAPVVNPRLAMGLREVRLDVRLLRVCKPEKIAHVTAHLSSSESSVYPPNQLVLTLLAP